MPEKKATTAKTAAKKSPTKKAAAKTVKKVATKVVAKKSKIPEAGVRPTSFAEVNRIYRGAVASAKGAVVVTSSRSGEGASLMTHLMAQRGAESGAKTLLIDLNLRNLELTKAFSVEPKEWKLKERKATDKLADLIQESEGVPGLFFMAAPTDSASILYLKDVENAKKFFASLEKQYDHVIVDTTPLSALNRGNVDPVLLSAAAKRTVVVMLAGVTPRRLIARTITQLQDAGAKVAGVVVNNRENPSVKNQLLSFVAGIGKLAPGLGDWLRHRVMNQANLD